PLEMKDKLHAGAHVERNNNPFCPSMSNAPLSVFKYLGVYPPPPLIISYLQRFPFLGMSFTAQRTLPLASISISVKSHLPHNFLGIPQKIGALNC
ncbi:MAG: hypothetical protein LBT48_00890, partial [Prevotellaceae bacterium]|nr:hypothetical protein [Prevotellaceae bacterium]